ncbi:cyclase family protein [Sphingomonas crusticola]|uniref:cyclase family protein n=1 Tax=Sphingomonas crusticola TaxID=1697973 RepID=UPI000E21F4FB|nr:cyclase family protein [Sphingomonas crusticola]
MDKPVLVDLSHSIEAGMVTYKGLPAPLVCDYLSREASRAHYEPGTEFAIQRIEMVGNTGTYLDSPFHRYADGADLAGLHLDQLAHLDTLVVSPDLSEGIAIEPAMLTGLDFAGKAVLLHTGWDRHWRTDLYFENHPYLTEAAAGVLADAGAALVGIDSHNIDDTRGRTRPAHSILLGRNIPICEHMTNLAALPPTGARFCAVPPKVAGFGTFPVRAFALLP